MVDDMRKIKSEICKEAADLLSVTADIPADAEAVQSLHCFEQVIYHIRSAKIYTELIKEKLNDKEMQ